MNPNTNPNLPNANNLTSGSSESGNQSNNPSPQVFSHEKVIIPLNSNIQPEEPPSPTRPATTVSNQPSTMPTPQASSMYPPVAQRSPINKPQTEQEWKPPNNLHKNILEASFVFGIASIAGALFNFWYKLAVKVLPNSISVCSNANHDAISLACHGTLFGNFFTFITLFSLASYITYRLFKKSHFLAYYYAGLFISLLSFFRLALALEPYAALKFHWLIPGNNLWKTWFLPALASGGLAMAIYALSKYTNHLVKNILSAFYVILFIASLVFVPGLVRHYVSNQNKVTPHEANQLLTDYVQQTVRESELTPYAVKDGSAPLEITDFRPLLDNTDIVPRYDIFYSLNHTGRYGGVSIETSVYKGSTVGYNPPTNCADPKKSKSQTSSPCTLFRTTKKGRQIYGSNNTTSYMQKLRPFRYYVAFNDITVSIRPAGDLDLLTDDAFDQFVDSLEPLTQQEVTKFTEKYLTAQ